MNKSTDIKKYVGYIIAFMALYVTIVPHPDLTDPSEWIGGVIGMVGMGSVVTDCYSSGNIKGGYYIGGVIGYNMYYDDAYVDNCHSSCTIIADEDAGGVIGYNNCGDVTNCYSSSTITTHLRGGGVIGYNSAGTYSNLNFNGIVHEDGGDHTRTVGFDDIDL